MTASVTLDSNVLIAARLARDQNHDRGRQIAEGMDGGSLPVGRVPSPVLQEVLNYVNERVGHRSAVATLDAILESSGFELVYTTSDDFAAGRSLFRRYEGLSLTDAIIATTMRRRNSAYLYSFDDDFDAVDGITRLTTPSDPFA